MKLLTEVHNCPGTLALASFLVAFLETVAFCLPHFCCPINNWAYGTADGLCPLPGTVTSKCDHRSLHFCMNLVTCYTCRAAYICPSSGGDFQGEHSHKTVLKKIVSHLHPNFIYNISLTKIFLFWHRAHHFIYSTFIFISFSFSMLPVFLHELVVFPRRPFPVSFYEFKTYVSCVRIMDFHKKEKLRKVPTQTCSEFWCLSGWSPGFNVCCSDQLIILTPVITKYQTVIKLKEHMLFSNMKIKILSMITVLIFYVTTFWGWKIGDWVKWFFQYLASVRIFIALTKQLSLSLLIHKLHSLCILYSLASLIFGSVKPIIAMGACCTGMRQKGNRADYIILLSFSSIFSHLGPQPMENGCSHWSLILPLSQ